LLRTFSQATYGSKAVVTAEGGISGLDDYNASPVRPAFRLDDQTPITRSDSVVAGETVYVLAE
jgi:hypothetical protein